MLDAGDGHSLYWEVCGSPEGKPGVVLRGGPGSGCSPGMRRLFDPQRYRIVLFDQRNAARSSRSASDPVAALSSNTPPSLLADGEPLRAHLDIDRWLHWVPSWAATLA